MHPWRQPKLSCSSPSNGSSRPWEGGWAGAPCQALPSQPGPRLGVPGQQPWGMYLAQLQVGERAGVDEGLGDHRQTGVDVVCLVDVEDKLGVFQDVDPKPQW